MNIPCDCCGLDIVDNDIDENIKLQKGLFIHKTCKPHTLVALEREKLISNIRTITGEVVCDVAADRSTRYVLLKIVQ